MLVYKMIVAATGALGEKNEGRTWHWLQLEVVLIRKEKMRMIHHTYYTHSGILRA
jgi:hypothetical protein